MTKGPGAEDDILLLILLQLLFFPGELKRPSRSIPTGSVSALLFVFFIFITEILLMAATTDRFVFLLSSLSSMLLNPFFRFTLLNNYLFLQDVNVWEPFVIIGIIAAVFSACLSGLIGASRILEALAVDEIFGKLKCHVQRAKESSVF